MAGGRKKGTSAAMLVLGLLAEDPDTPSGVAARLKERFSMARFAPTAVYTAANRMTRDGLLRVVDMSSMRDSERVRLMGTRVAWCSREGPGFDLLVRDFVALPALTGRRRSRTARGDAEAALARLGIEECAGQRWSELSSWERMCAALARGVVCRPQLLLVDDLLDGMGMLRTQRAGDLLRGLAREVGCAVLLTVSEIEAAFFTDRMLLLQGGSLRMMETAPAPDRASVIAFPEQRVARRER